MKPQILRHPDGTREWSLNGLRVLTTPIEVRATDTKWGRRRVYELLKPYSVIMKTREFNLSVDVPAGYQTDFGSVPIIAQVLLGNRDNYLHSFLAHDALCDQHFPPFIANGVLRMIMLATGVPMWKRLTYYYALQIMGYGSPPRRLWNWFVGHWK